MAVKRPTQADVARAAGVSQTAVSIVLNDTAGSTVRLSPGTRERVLRALEITGYVVNPIARSLAGHRTNILGVFGFEPVFGSNSDSFYLPFMEGIEQAAEAAARDLLLFSSAARDGSEHHIYRQNENRLRLVDACILIGNGEPRLELSRLAQENYPFVFIGRREIPGVDVPYVTADYSAATHDLLVRLRDLGHRHLAYLAAGQAVPSSLERITAMEAGVQELQLSVQTVVVGDGPQLDDVRRVRDAIDRGATVLMVEPLVDVEAVTEQLESAGVRIPDDVSAVVLGDPVNSRRSSSYWSGYALPRHEMGRAAVEMLLEMLESANPVATTRVIACLPLDGQTLARPRPSVAPESGAAR